MEKNKNTLLGIIVAIVVLLVLFGGLGMGSYGLLGFGMGFGFLFMILFWGVIIWLIVTLVNATAKKEDVTEKPLDILKKRFAKGEINKKQFEEMKKELT